MQVTQFIADMQRRLHPDPYTEIVRPPDDPLLMLLRCRKLGARYALAVATWDERFDGTALLGTVRDEVRRLMDASWPFRPVGLYLVVCGDQAKWAEQVAVMPADKTGLHAVIVQAVQFVDLATSQTALNQSAWGPVRFGGVDSLAATIKSMLSPPF
jgi:hypothetical protein